jgi:hypothetical protein
MLLRSTVLPRLQGDPFFSVRLCPKKKCYFSSRLVRTVHLYWHCYPTGEEQEQKQVVGIATALRAGRFESLCSHEISVFSKTSSLPLGPTHHSFQWIPYFLLRGRLRLKCDGTRAETRYRLSAKRTSPFKSAGASVQSTTGSRGFQISGSNAGYTMFRGSVKSTG